MGAYHMELNAKKPSAPTESLRDYSSPIVYHK